MSQKGEGHIHIVLTLLIYSHIFSPAIPIMGHTKQKESYFHCHREPKRRGTYTDVLTLSIYIHIFNPAIPIMGHTMVNVESVGCLHRCSDLHNQKERSLDDQLQEAFASGVASPLSLGCFSPCMRFTAVSLERNDIPSLLAIASNFKWIMWVSR